MPKVKLIKIAISGSNRSSSYDNDEFFGGVPIALFISDSEWVEINDTDLSIIKDYVKLNDQFILVEETSLIETKFLFHEILEEIKAENRKQHREDELNKKRRVEQSEKIESKKLDRKRKQLEKLQKELGM